MSDVHLSYGSDEHELTTTRFETVLAAAHGHLSGLVILGDLFDAWVGDDQLLLPESPMKTVALRVIDSIAALSVSQVSGRFPVYIGRGNRDFLLGSGFISALRARRVDAHLLADLNTVTVTRKDATTCQVLLAHGDQWCTDDTDYQKFRAMVRDPQWQEQFLKQPLEQRLALAQQMRSGSESAKQDKSVEIMDVNRSAIESVFLDSEVSVIIHGHTHRPATHVYSIDHQTRRRFVLTDWDGSQNRGGIFKLSTI